tara:strand:- start:52 stop:315 length:264 start_codon:yes stop_codon:yes gene_type:complete
MTHPLTLQEIAKLSGQDLITQAICDDMRAAADWQLEQVLGWLDENLSNYTDNEYFGDLKDLNSLEDDLKQAMRLEGSTYYRLRGDHA